MRRSSSFLIAILLSVGLTASAVAQTAPSQAASGAQALGSVTNGNTTIVFEPANLSDIDTQALRTWQDFATAHPSIARALAYKPLLMNEARYLKKHPELGDFFQAHPEVREAMAANPGNFNAIPPRPGE